MKLTELAATLRQQHVVDGGRLKLGGLRELRQALHYWRQQGRPAYVLLLDERKALQPYRALASAMELEAERELLVVCNGLRWEATGWGLSNAHLSRILDASEPELSEYWAKGLVAVLDRAGEAATGKSRPGADAPSAVPALAALVGTAAVSGLAWVIWRRRKLAHEGSRALEDAVGQAQARFADVMLESEVLDPQETVEIQSSAARLHDELVRLGKSQPGPTELRVTLARVQQLDNELAALDSRILTQRRQGREP